MVSSDSNYLNSQLDSIKSANNKCLNNIDIKSASYGSTANIPRREPVYVEQLIKASRELMEKLNAEINSIVKVGKEFENMDNFLANQSKDLGFGLESSKVKITEAKEFKESSVSSLLENDVPIIKGYNDQFGRKNSSGSGGYFSGGGYSTENDTFVEDKGNGTKSYSTGNNITKLSASTYKSIFDDSDTKEIASSKGKDVEKITHFVEKYVESKGDGQMEPSQEDTILSFDNPRSNNVSHMSSSGSNVVLNDVAPSNDLVTPDIVAIDDNYNAEAILDVNPDNQNEQIDIIDNDIIESIDNNLSNEEITKEGPVKGSSIGVIAGVGLAAGAAALYANNKMKEKEENEDEEENIDENSIDYIETSGGEE